MSEKSTGSMSTKGLPLNLFTSSLLKGYRSDRHDDMRPRLDSSTAAAKPRPELEPSINTRLPSRRSSGPSLPETGLFLKRSRIPASVAAMGVWYRWVMGTTFDRIRDMPRHLLLFRLPSVRNQKLDTHAAYLPFRMDASALVKDIP